MRPVAKSLSAFLALALVTSACSAGDDAENSADTVEAAGGAVDDSAAELAFTSTTEAGSSDSFAEAASIEELEAQWAERRAEIVAELSSDDYGVGDDNVLRGPGGFEVDLNDCPSNWSDTDGLDGGTIRIAQTLPLTGRLAAAGNISVGMRTYFDYVNANGGIDGKQIELVVEDDAYEPAQTVALVDRLLDDKTFAISTLGTGNTLGVYDKLNRLCVPQPFVIGGHPSTGDPEHHPWTTGFQISYGTEAILWGNWIKQNLADELPVKVGALVMGSDFGAAYSDAFQAWADANPDVVAQYSPVSHDPAAATVADEVTAVKVTDPDVLILMTVGAFCPMAITEIGASELGDSVGVKFAPSVCKDPTSYLAPAGEAADGFMIAGGGTKATSDAQFADDVYVKWVNEQLVAAGRDTTIGYYGTGFADYGWAHVEAMRIAAELPGGLSRTNLLLAIRSLDLEHPILLDGISFVTNGDEDAYFIEGSEFSRFDAATQSWVQQGPAIDLNGSSPNCAWGPQGC